MTDLVVDAVNVRLTTAAESTIVAAMNPPPLILKNGPAAAAWLVEHIAHPPGIKVTAKMSRCLGCGSRLREPLQVVPLR